LVGITVPIKILSGEKEVVFDAKIDTGSSHCIFRRKHGERLGLKIESGEFHEFSTATGNFSAYGHEVNISVLGISLYSKVYFASEEFFNRNVLGRIGWLDRVQIGLVDYEGKLYLNSYESEIF
ncbi:MAG: retropepsin-like aspartic protease, partial [Aridibacter sp.]